MLRRGQKIEVVKYYGKKNMRPKVGDIGYLSNMFLYPEKNLILADAVFFQYGCDDENNRLEHKRFVIDVGMERGLKHKIVNVGVSRSFFTDNFHINLNPVSYSRNNAFNNSGRYGGISFDRNGKPRDTSNVYKYWGWNCNGTWPKVVGSFGVWTSATSRKGKSLNDSKVKLPCISIKPYIGKASSITRKETNVNMLRAWFIAVGMPITSIITNSGARVEYRREGGNERRSGMFRFANRCQELASNLFGYNMRSNGDGFYTVDPGKDVRKHVTSGDLSQILQEFRQLEVQHKMFINRLDEETINLIGATNANNYMQDFINGVKFNKDGNLRDVKTTFSPFWTIPMEDLGHKKLHEMLVSLFFRALLNSATSEDILDMFRAMPVVGGDIMSKSNKEIKQFKEQAAFDNSLLGSVLQWTVAS